MQVDDNSADHTLQVTHDVPFEVSFVGAHALRQGMEARLMPLSTHGCSGSASADRSIYGSMLDSTLSMWVTLPGGVDGTGTAIYVLCLAERPSDPLADHDFTRHAHVTAVVSHLPPSMPPPPRSSPVLP